MSRDSVILSVNRVRNRKAALKLLLRGRDSRDRRSGVFGFRTLLSAKTAKMRHFSVDPESIVGQRAD